MAKFKDGTSSLNIGMQSIGANKLATVAERAALVMCADFSRSK
jgi:hypothetical protein